MKQTIYILLLILYSQLVSAQNIDYNLIKYKGLNFLSTKAEIENKLGTPKKTFEPNYECGFLSSDWQGVEIITLDYNSVKFTGNE